MGEVLKADFSSLGDVGTACNKLCICLVGHVVWYLNVGNCFLCLDVGLDQRVDDWSKLLVVGNEAPAVLHQVILDVLNGELSGCHSIILLENERQALENSQTLMQQYLSW